MSKIRNYKKSNIKFYTNVLYLPELSQDLYFHSQKSVNYDN
ncbi:hypothetical protein CNEO4_340060 [Clostridium neonatale]|nr:hypothetical protein CNEO_480006 [Clostridium neonatale]CAI3540928.1 hypothetical protein CNEO4_180060 [Clostridium neonatale]CAI3606013.1 hypothetical protein CNEO4_340060 [Clostridium neonatale]CAI3629137.1 hypothetical protein CNEO3_240059 [Clostridium neonatale]